MADPADADLSNTDDETVAQCAGALASIQSAIEVLMGEPGQELESIEDVQEDIQMAASGANNITQTAEVADAPFNADAQVDAARRFLECGMKFKGTIAIPGWNQTVPEEMTPEEEERREYLLEIVGVHESVIYARHSAYGDEQSCNVDLEPPEEAGNLVRISYSDCETQCSGTVDAVTGQIRGTVRQLIHGDAGFYHPSTDVTHTFELSPSISSSAAAHNEALVIACSERARLVAAWSTSCQAMPAASVLSHASGFLEGVAETVGRVPWKDVFEHSSLAAEDLCARLRLQARVMRELQFECHTTKEQELAVRAEFMTRSKAHQLVDAALGQLQGVFRCWASFSMSSGDDNLHRLCINNSLLTMCKCHERLQKAYDTLHQAMQSAERRLAKDTLDGWSQAGDGSGQCSICMMTLEVDDTALILPCKHMFHVDCCTTWLHQNSSCPNCRHDVGSGEQGATNQ